jgi:hypothetical protein
VIKERDRPATDEDRDFGRDGVSGLVTADRALRARDVSRPRRADQEWAAQVVDDLIARAEGRSQRR